MGHFTCRCGAVLSLKTGVEEHEKIIIQKRFVNEGLPELIENWESIEASPFIDKVAAQQDHIWLVIDENSSSVICCPTCSRIWIEQKLSGEFISYVKEDG